MPEQGGNRLIHEKSPYLLQHADNPVDWYPWGEAAFEKAAKEDKPVFLSIGYSTCHWCHVMAHESFEDPEVAQLMNETVVSVKVDREERPDLDNVYMTVCQALTGRGGWPLTILMTPQKEPFFAGTYFPKADRFQMTGMMSLLPKVHELWKSRRGDVLDSAQRILTAVRGMDADGPGEDPRPADLDRAFKELRGRFDREHGGFGDAPKFPSPHQLLFLLRYHYRNGDPEALDMATATLRAMRQGGMYDHVGGGFHRYSTDRTWLVPHFEKMLYDQALLSMAYLEAYQVTGDSAHARTAEQIFAYVARDLTAPEGGFYSAEDADSEGEEGKFYLWTEAEIREVLAPKEADLVIRLYGIRADGNFHDEVTGRKTGKNIFHLSRPLSDWARELNLSPEDLETRLTSALSSLLSRRQERIRPHKDDKILTDWNGLMIAALAQGARVLEDSGYADTAKGAADFLLTRLREKNGRLLHRYRGGHAGIPAHLDDIAFLVWGLIELYETLFDPAILEWALDLNQDMIAHYRDPDSGGFFFTPDDGERLILRKKEIYDGAIPSGNSVSLQNLLRLARLTGRSELEEIAAATAKAFSIQVSRMPSAFTGFLTGVDFALGPTREVVIVGPADSDGTREMIRTVRRGFHPRRLVLVRPTGNRSSEKIDKLAPFLQDYKGVGEQPTAYVCTRQSCEQPTTDVSQLTRRLQRSEGL
jgi:hypothetical protein